MYDGAQFSTSKLVSWLFPDPRSAGLFETPEPMRLTQRDKLVAVILAVLFFGMHVYLFWGEWAVDASAYYFAGHFYDIGQFDQVYAGPPQIIGPEIPETWAAALAQTGYPDEQTYPFIYLPWVAALMAPVTRTLDPQNFMNGVLIINTALMVICSGLAWRIMGGSRNPLWIWAIISFGILTTSSASVLALSLGQIQILVFACCLLAIERYRAGAFWLAGAALALAACLKITPAAFILIFIWDRNWRALSGFAVVCAIIGAYSYAVLGMDLHHEFFGLLHDLNQQIFIAFLAFSVEGFVFQIWDLLNGTAVVLTDHEYTYPKPAWIDHTAKAIFAFGVLALWLTTRNLGASDRIPRQFIALSILIPITAPLGWIHYFLLTGFLLPGLACHMGKRMAALLILGFFMLLNSYLVVILLFPELRFTPQIVLCVPFLLFMFGAIVAGKRPQEVAKTEKPLHAVPAE